jgi:hypothetical protein
VHSEHWPRLRSCPLTEMQLPWFGVPQGVTGCAIVAVLALIGVGCSNQGILDQAPLANFVDVRVVNDSAETVEVTGCWDRHCHDTKTMLTDSIRPSQYRDEALWNNSDPGVGAVRFHRGGSTVGCVAFRWRKGQEHATLSASQATPCT